MSTRLGRLVASGKPVEVNRYAGTVGQGLMIQLTAETGYVQVQLAELLRMLLNPRSEDVPDPWELLEAVHRELVDELPDEITIELGGIARLASKLGEVVKARRAALANT